MWHIIKSRLAISSPDEFLVTVCNLIPFIIQSVLY